MAAINHPLIEPVHTIAHRVAELFDVQLPIGVCLSNPIDQEIHGREHVAVLSSLTGHSLGQTIHTLNRRVGQEGIKRLAFKLLVLGHRQLVEHFTELVADHRQSQESWEQGGPTIEIPPDEIVADDEIVFLLGIVSCSWIL